MALKQIANRVYSGLTVDLPSTLPEGSVFIDVENKKLYGYDSSGLPFVGNLTNALLKTGETSQSVEGNVTLLGELDVRNVITHYDDDSNHRVEHIIGFNADNDVYTLKIGRQPTNVLSTYYERWYNGIEYIDIRVDFSGDLIVDGNTYYHTGNLASSPQGTKADNSVQKTGELSQDIEGGIRLLQNGQINPTNSATHKNALVYTTNNGGNNFYTGYFTGGFYGVGYNTGTNNLSTIAEYRTQGLTINGSVTGTSFIGNSLDLGTNFKARLSGLNTVLESITGSGTLFIRSLSNIALADNGGNVGIGTATPTQKLQVNGNFVLGNASSQTNTNNKLAVFDNGSNFYGSTFGFNNNRYRTQIVSAPFADISFGVTNAYPTLQSHVTEQMVLRGDTGNLGIGTLNPSQKLDVVGDIKVSGTQSEINGIKIGLSGGNRFFGTTLNNLDIKIGDTFSGVLGATSLRYREKISVSASNFTDVLSLNETPSTIIPNSQGSQITFHKKVNHLPFHAFINTDEKTYSSGVKTNLHLFSGKNLTDGGLGTVILQHDGLEQKGNVAIGQTTADEMLDVNGNVKATAFVSPNVLGDKVSLLNNRIGLTNMYGFGVSANVIYYKSAGVHEFYSAKNYDGVPNADVKAGNFIGSGAGLIDVVKKNITALQEIDGPISFNDYMRLYSTSDKRGILFWKPGVAERASIVHDDFGNLIIFTGDAGTEPSSDPVNGFKHVIFGNRNTASGKVKTTIIRSERNSVGLVEEINNASILELTNSTERNFFGFKLPLLNEKEIDVVLDNDSTSLNGTNHYGDFVNGSNTILNFTGTTSVGSVIFVGEFSGSAIDFSTFRAVVTAVNGSTITIDRPFNKPDGNYVLPRVTAGAKSVPEGLTVFNTDKKTISFYNGNTWVNAAITKTKSKTAVTTYSFTQANNETAPLFTAGSNVSAVFAAGLTIGTTFEFSKFGTGNILLSGESGVTLRVPTGEVAEIEDQYAIVTAEVVDTNEILLTGRLKLA